MKYLFIILTLLIASGCDVSLNVAHRSGSMDDDYIAEPLSGSSAEYSKLLETSNAFIEAVKNKDYKLCYEKLFDEQLRSIITFDQFVATMSDLDMAAGGIINFKPMQWHFFPSEEEGLSLVSSIKIAEHEKTMVNYRLVFDKNGDGSKVLGFFFKQRSGVLFPGNF